MGKKDHGTRLTAAMLKERAKQLGASVCGIGDIERFHGVDAQHNPLSILPGATCVIGIGFAVPTGLYRAISKTLVTTHAFSAAFQICRYRAARRRTRR